MIFKEEVLKNAKEPLEILIRSLIMAVNDEPTDEVKTEKDFVEFTQKIATLTEGDWSDFVTSFVRENLNEPNVFDFENLNMEDSGYGEAVEPMYVAQFEVNDYEDFELYIAENGFTFSHERLSRGWNDKVEIVGKKSEIMEYLKQFYQFAIFQQTNKNVMELDDNSVLDAIVSWNLNHQTHFSLSMQ